MPQPVMELEVKKSNIDTEHNPDSGVRCLLYEARKNLGTQASDEALLKKKKLQEINPKFALSQIMSTGGTNLQETKFGKCPSAVAHMQVTSYSAQSLIFKFSVILTQCLEWTVMMNKMLFLYILHSLCNNLSSMKCQMI